MFIRQYTKKYVILIYKGVCIQHSHVLLCRKCPCCAQTLCRNGTLCRKCPCGAQTPCRNGSLCRNWAYSAQFCGVSPVTGPKLPPVLPLYLSLKLNWEISLQHNLHRQVRKRQFHLHSRLLRHKGRCPGGRRVGVIPCPLESLRVMKCGILQPAAVPCW